MRSAAKTSKLPSRQLHDIMRFLEDNTDQENHYIISNVTEDSQNNDEDNDVQKETDDSQLPADTDVFKTFSRRLKKVTTSYNETRCHHNTWKKTSGLRHLEDL